MWYFIYFQYADMKEYDWIVVYSESRLKQMLEEYQATQLCRQLAYAPYKRPTDIKKVHTNFSQTAYDKWLNS